MSQTSTNTGPRPQDIAYTKQIVATNKIFIDTCSFLHDCYPHFEKLLFPILKDAKEKLYVPIKVIEELQRFKKSDSHKCNNAASYALKSIANHQHKGLIELKGEESDNFADNVFLCQFVKFRMHYNLVLITQDNKLASDLLNLNNVKSSNGKKVSVCRITSYGTLGRNNGSAIQQHNKDIYCVNEEHNQINSNNNSISEEKVFSIKKQITTLKDSLLPVSHIPGEGEKVCSALTRDIITLSGLIAKGGEGSVFKTNAPRLVCKIYKKENLTRFRLEKLRRMVDSGLQYEGVCWPTDVVMNREGQPVGYLMPKAEGIELQKCVFIPPLLKKHFSNWTKHDTVQLALTILEKIEYLHHHNIIIGDINPLNILVKSPTEVYFVDTDSYQIEEFPCPVGTVPFTAPEAQQKHFATFLRSFGNEQFAVATLLFMIMLPGKHPYAQQGGEDPISNIKKMDFSYALGEKSNKKTPDGRWRFCWSHLPYKVKEAFYETFHFSGQYAKEVERLNAQDWIALFSEYRRLLESGKFEQRDPESILLFPTRYKNVSNSPLGSCSLCGQQYTEEQLQQGYCRVCLKKGEEYKCRQCGDTILFTNYRRYILKAKPFDICQQCFQQMNEVYATDICCDCSSNFTITNGERDYYLSKNFTLPKRCPTCRKAKKANKPATTSSKTGPISTYDSPSSGGLGGLLGSIINFFNTPR
jgi:rRNA-processing protein FCF1/tRNA A-37 threonylcarbamoyl transferase component Bud32